jgi:hypothetical protein
LSANRADPSADQMTLPLSPTPIDPASESALRAAFKRLALARRMSFEEAIARPALAIGIRNLAEASAKRGGQAIQTKRRT